MNPVMRSKLGVDFKSTLLLGCLCSYSAIDWKARPFFSRGVAIKPQLFVVC
jgi:hypothetical protein